MADYRLFVQRWFKEELSNDLSFVILNEVKDLRLGVTRSFANDAQDDIVRCGNLPHPRHRERSAVICLLLEWTKD